MLEKSGSSDPVPRNVGPLSGPRVFDPLAGLLGPRRRSLLSFASPLRSRARARTPCCSPFRRSFVFLGQRLASSHDHAPAALGRSGSPVSCPQRNTAESCPSLQLPPFDQ